jgi:hypothetical protein
MPASGISDSSHIQQGLDCSVLTLPAMKGQKNNIRIADLRHRDQIVTQLALPQTGESLETGRLGSNVAAAQLVQTRLRYYPNRRIQPGHYMSSIRQRLHYPESRRERYIALGGRASHENGDAERGEKGHGS